MRSILDINGKPPRSIGARRIGSLYSTGEGGQADRKAATGVYLLDRIEAALDQAGGDPVKASAICGVEAREIAKVQGLMRQAEEQNPEELRLRRSDMRRKALGVVITDKDIAELIAAFKAKGRLTPAGLSLGWTKARTESVYKFAVQHKRWPMGGEV